MKTTNRSEVMPGPFIHKLIKEVTDGCSTVLDLGAGNGAKLQHCADSVEQRYALDLNPVKTDEVEVTVIKGDMRNFADLAPSDCNEAVLLIDSLEHIKFDEGLALLQELQLKFSSIGVVTPRGLTETGLDGLMKHRSGWTVEDFEGLGFEVTVFEDFHHRKGGNHIDALFATWKTKKSVLNTPKTSSYDSLFKKFSKN